MYITSLCHFLSIHYTFANVSSGCIAMKTGQFCIGPLRGHNVTVRLIIACIDLAIIDKMYYSTRPVTLDRYFHSDLTTASCRRKHVTADRRRKEFSGEYTLLRLVVSGTFDSRCCKSCAGNRAMRVSFRCIDLATILSIMANATNTTTFTQIRRDTASFCSVAAPCIPLGPQLLSSRHRLRLPLL